MRKRRHVLALPIAAALASCGGEGDQTPATSAGTPPAIVATEPMAGTGEAALRATLERFDAALAANDMGTMTAMMPPGILSYLAEQNGVTEQELQDGMEMALAQAMETVTIVEATTDDAGATYGTIGDNRPYALVPTRTVLDVESVGRVVTNSDTLALNVDEQWYLMRVDQPQQTQIATAVYPELGELQFTPATTEIIAPGDAP